MKKLFLLVSALLLSLSVQAVEVGGVKLADSVHLGGHDLLLNGAGVRSKFIFDLYVAALYLAARNNSAALVLADANEKRVALHLLRDIGSATLAESFDKAIKNNHSPAELLALVEPLKQFKAVFATLSEVKQGEVITLDYLPASGTQISVNGVVKGKVAGAAFNTALLKVWLGEKPAQTDLKRKLLGGE